ncbi:hypothetical protein SAMN05421783_111129 [Thiocapsa roseopersicina]|uniref:Uncharacterized protein n=1 Tax=Thiocapsa roseopersicina TaxID=1058 RepID=A0A1H2XW54_THIRO|nr:hypothetical protein SAMN05421783_111129 [Thiocapsa roseopersicina]
MHYFGVRCSSPGQTLRAGMAPGLRVDIEDWEARPDLLCDQLVLKPAIRLRATHGRFVPGSAEIPWIQEPKLGDRPEVAAVSGRRVTAVDDREGSDHAVRYAQRPASPVRFAHEMKAP